MNEVEKITYAIINKAIKEKDFIDWESIYALHKTHGVKCIIEITPKGIAGKSTAAINHIMKNLKSNPDYNAAWLRNTEAEKKGSKVDSSFTKALVDNKFNMKEWIVRSDGVYQKMDPDNKMEKGLLKVIFAYLNLPLNVGSQNSLKCDDVILDEFINPNFSKAHLGYDFYNMIKTLQRTKNALVICMANAHESDNDILNAFGLNEFDWESGKTQVVYREEQKVLGIYVEAYKNKYMQKADDDTDNLFQYCDEVLNFRQGKVANNNSWGVKNWYINNIEDSFQPMFKYDCNGTCYCVGQWNKDVYVRQLSLQPEYPNLPRLCYKAVDKREYNTLVCDVHNYSTVKFLINNYSAGRLYFSTAYGRDEFIQNLLPNLQLFLNEENKKTL